MDVFGVKLTIFDLYLLGIVGALIIFLLGIRVPDIVKRTNVAKAEFRSTFDQVILNIEENADCPIAQVSYRLRNQHLTAIIKYRTFVPFWKRSGFDNAVEEYKKACETAQEHGSVFALVDSQRTNDSRIKRGIYSKTIHRLLTYT